MARNTKFSVSASPFLVPFFNFFFYLGMIPFKTEQNASSDKYKLKTYLLQQMFCGVVHIGQLIMVSFYTWDRIKNIKSDISSSIFLFDCVSNVGSTVSGIFLFYLLWMRRDKYLLTIESTRCTIDSRRKLKAIHAFVYLGQTFLLIFFGTFQFLLVREQSNCFPFSKMESSFRETDSYTKISNISISNLTLKNVENTSGGFLPINLNQENWTASENILFLITTLYINQYYVFSQIIFLILVLALRLRGKQFIGEIKNDCFNETGVEKGIQKYRHLKATTDLIGDAYGDALLGYYVSAVAYYAETPHVFLGIRGEMEKMVMIYFVISGIIWILAAEFHNNVRVAVVKWIEFHSDQTDITYDNRLRLYTISGQVSTHDTSTIALSNKCFSVTYTHLGSMLSLVLTYAIIVFQLHQETKYKT